MSQHLIPIALCLGAAAAQTVLQIPFYGVDAKTYDASAIGASGGATTLSIACPPNVSDCGAFPAFTLTYGSSTYRLDVSQSGDYTGTQDCTPSGTTSAVCVESVGGSAAPTQGVSTTTYTGTDVQVVTVSVTAGASNLSGGAAATSTGASSTASGSSAASGSSTGSSASITSNASSSGSHSSTAGASAASSTSSKGAGVPMMPPTSGLLAAVAGIFGLFI